MEDPNFKPLTPEQEHFCQLYTSKSDYSRKAYKCYAEAYKIEIPDNKDGEVDFKSTEYKTCVSSGSRLLTKDYIQARIREIYLSMFTDSHIDARLNEIITNGNESNSVQAIKIANDLKQRITKKLDITSAGRPLASASDEELDAIANS